MSSLLNKKSSFNLVSVSERSSFTSFSSPDVMSLSVSKRSVLVMSVLASDARMFSSFNERFTLTTALLASDTRMNLSFNERFSFITVLASDVRLPLSLNE